MSSGCWEEYAREGRNYLVAGILSTVTFGIASGLLQNYGIDRLYAELLVGFVLCVVLFASIREPACLGRVSIRLGLIGVLCASVYFFIFERGGVIYISANGIMVALLLGLFNGGVVVPLFEEMVVRRLLFRGIASYVGPSLSAVMVSVLFGLAHVNIFITAMIFSMAMCFLTYKGVSTVNRSILHGCYNVTLQGLWLVFGVHHF
jgi:hypothetical protein